MKRLFYTILLLMFAIATQAQNIPSYVPTNGLVGWWPFNGNANDESGNGNHGTVNGATLTSDRNGVANNAFSFNGSSVLIPLNQSIVEMSSRTIALWFKSNGNQWGGRLFEATNVSWGCALYNSNKIDCWYQKSNQAYNATNLSFSNHNEWYSLIYVCDSINQIVKAYLNGNLIYNSIPVSNLGSPNAWQGHFLKIGIGIANEVFNGTIDDIAIYNRALSQQEITALYTGNPPCTPTSSNFNLTIPSTSLPYTWNGLTFNSSGSQTAHLTNTGGCDSAATLNLTVTNTIPSYIPTNGLVGWWPFNGNANDESGNGNHGTVNGATLTSDRNGVLNKSFEFNGIHKDNIGISLINSINNDVTISLWYFSNSSNGGPFVHIGQDNPGTPFCDGFDIGKGGTSINNSGNNLISGFSCIGYYNSNIQGLTGSWNHVVLVKLNNKVKISLNGILVSDIATISSINPSPYVFFASTSSLNSTFFTGSLDDIAIYNRALTQQEITALYSGLPNFDIASSSGPNGSITPIGTTTLNQGNTQSYTFSPNTGYLVDSVIVDGNKVDSIQGYTFSNVSANHSIRVIFKIDSNNVSMNFPTGISYQAVARDSAGKLLANSPVKLRFSIKENSMNGNTVYTETANLTTNKLGLFTCIIGNNNAILGNYKNIDWMGASKFLQVELEQAGNYVLLGSQQLLSVPYANAANKSKEASKIKNANLPVYPDNNAALQDGLQAGEMYRTNAGILMIVY